MNDLEHPTYDEAVQDLDVDELELDAQDDFEAHYNFRYGGLL